MDFTSAGLWDGVKKAGKVALWVAVSGAVSALIAELAAYEPRADQVWAVIAVLAANALLAGISKWLTTRR